MQVFDLRYISSLFALLSKRPLCGGIFKVFQAQEDTLPSHAFSAASCFARILGLPYMTCTKVFVFFDCLGYDSVMNSGN